MYAFANILLLFYSRYCSHAVTTNDDSILQENVAIWAKADINGLFRGAKLNFGYFFLEHSTSKFADAIDKIR